MQLILASIKTTWTACFSAHLGSTVGFAFCSSVPLVLFENPGFSKCLNTLFLLSSRLCFIIGFVIC